MTIKEIRISARELAIILGALVTFAGLLLGAATLRVPHAGPGAAGPIEAPSLPAAHPPPAP
jgi:hypothetical protein